MDLIVVAINAPLEDLKDQDGDRSFLRRSIYRVAKFQPWFDET